MKLWGWGKEKGGARRNKGEGEITLCRLPFAVCLFLLLDSIFREDSSNLQIILMVFCQP
jgi:hypothetical protein